MVHRSLTPKRRKMCIVDLGFISAVLVVLKGSAVVLVLNGLLLAQSEQKAFASAEDASQALFAAVQTGDRAAMLNIFGRGGNEVIYMGDAVEDRNTREQFVAKYKEMHRLAQERDGTTTLYIGSENWALPVPLVDESGAWHFDTEASKKEILFRRIGDNEYAVIDVCHALVNAQNDYYSQSRGGRVQQYAQAFASDEGQYNGLFLKTAEGEPESPIGLLAAYSGSADGTRQQENNSRLHGYYFRILTAQGKSASGGARSYLVNGQMTSGFAILAYPADYRSSGVMTFIVNQSGDVFQKDLGTKTAELAAAMKEYGPDETWEMTE
jgi:hypothetical protein